MLDHACTMLDHVAPCWTTFNMLVLGAVRLSRASHRQLRFPLKEYIGFTAAIPSMITIVIVLYLVTVITRVRSIRAVNGDLKLRLDVSAMPAGSSSAPAQSAHQPPSRMQTQPTHGHQRDVEMHNSPVTGVC